MRTRGRGTGFARIATGWLGSEKLRANAVSRPLSREHLASRDAQDHAALGPSRWNREGARRQHQKLLDGALCAPKRAPRANQIPTDPESREVFPETVGVIRAGFLLPGVGEKRAAGIGERTTR